MWVTISWSGIGPGRRLAATLYLGAARSADRTAGLHAHAWLRCGALVLTGENERRNFPVLTSFRAEPRWER